MRAVFAVIIMLIATGIGVADPVEDLTLGTCDAVNPTQQDLTDLCTYQYDFGTYGDAPRQCSTTTDKEVVIDDPAKDALFVFGIDMSDHFRIEKTTSGYDPIDVLYEPSIPLTTIPTSSILVAISYECWGEVARSIGPADEPLSVRADLYGTGTYVVRARMIVGLVQESPQECGPNHDNNCAGWATSLDPDLMVGPLYIQTQCQPVCAPNMVDAIANPLVGYKMKASRTTT